MSFLPVETLAGTKDYVLVACVSLSVCGLFCGNIINPCIKMSYYTKSLSPYGV
ncbi:hypothetical protein HAL013_02090 [Helicobacter ailurogastricus]|uniref:Uncharacterized protein n=1 Tax=Helicobacter ailurogastricus TaxID=1578720 RepID=A0A0K2XBH3_9HELI|nr:hypothetical protein HAL013_02090 [Helicobacter ailurogastricus]